MKSFMVGIISALASFQVMAGEGNLQCILVSKSYPSVALPSQILFPFRGSAPLRNGNSLLKVRPQNIRWFPETSVTTEADRKEFEAQPPVPSPIEYLVRVRAGVAFAASLLVKTNKDETLTLNAAPVPYVKVDGNYPTATFQFDVSEITLADEVRTDGYSTWTLSLECHHQIPND